MDNDTLRLLAKVTIQARKSIGAIDSNLLVKDAGYRDTIFRRIDEEADEELLMLSLTLRSKLGILNIEQSPSAKEKDKEAAPVENAKYTFGTRG